LAVNDIGEVVFELQQPLPLAPYADNRIGGALIVVDPSSHRTSGALLVRTTEPA
jgi:sulfate adenylyltransferase subunit 1